MNKPKDLQGYFLTKFTLKNILVPRAFARAAHAKPHVAVKTKNHKCLAQEVEYSTDARTEMRACQTFCCHRIFYKILHLPDILNAFISLELVAVDAFEIHDFCEKKFFKKISDFQIFKKKSLNLKQL